MLDLRLGTYQIDNAEKLIRLIKKHPGSCDEVWLNGLGGFPKMEKHIEAAEKMKKAAELFKKNGIKVSVQITNTLGHGDVYAKTNDFSGFVYPGSGAETMVGPDGAKAEYCFCLYGENFRKYIADTVKIYAQIKPDCLWIDDDLRAMHHFPVEYTCYCDDCITRFNNKYNTSFTREELVNEINYGDIIWRERYINQLKEGFSQFSSIITKAAMEVSPDTQMGYEYGRFFNYLGNDYTYVLESMYKESGKPVKTRPGGGFYDDKRAEEMLYKLMEVDCANAMLPEYVSDRCPEIESIPSVCFGKSLEGNCKEATLYLAYGSNGLTFASLNRMYETDEYDDTLLKWLSKYRPYWDKLIKYNEGTYFGGVGIYESLQSYKKPLKEDEKPFSWVEIVGKKRLEFMKIGVPVTRAKENISAFVLYPEAVDFMADDDILQLIKKPVITDAEALGKLYERGFGKYFGASVNPIETSSAQEIFTSHPVNGNNAGIPWKASVYVNNNSHIGAYEIVDCDGKTESIGEYRNVFDDSISYGCVNAIIKTYDENKNELASWAVFGYSLWQDIISSVKRNQILNAIDYICNNTLPAKLLSSEQVLVAPRIDKDGKLVCVSLQSITIGNTEPMKLLVRNPKTEKFILSNEDISLKELEYEKTDDGYVINLPPLSPWDIYTVFFE